MAEARDDFDPYRYAKYASMKLPNPKWGNHEYYCHTEQSLVIQNLHPKSLFHLILIPRVGRAPRVPQNMSNIWSVLSLNNFSKEEAFDLLKDMYNDALKMKEEIEKDMLERWGFKWTIWMGFHLGPSYRYLHLHIMSNDLLGKGMKSLHHFRSFHPHLGDFKAITKLLEWEDIEDHRFASNVRELRQRGNEIYARRRGDLGPDKRPLTCYYEGCEANRDKDKDEDGLETFPKLKDHLQKEFDAMVERMKKQAQRHMQNTAKRKRDLLKEAQGKIRRRVQEEEETD